MRKIGVLSASSSLALGALCLVAVFAFLAHGSREAGIAHAQELAAGACPAVPSLNPLQVPLRRWYKHLSIPTFPVGPEPTSLAFDGENIWDVDAGGLTKIRANDGAILGTVRGFASVSQTTRSIVYDGYSLWVASATNDFAVTRVRASDGTILGKFGPGPAGPGLAFDGANIWVANGGGLVKLRASDGATVGTFPVNGGTTGPAFDGTYLWVSNQLANTVSKLNPDGNVVGVFPSGGTSPGNIAFDGANIWVINFFSQNVTELRAKDGAMLGTFPLLGFPLDIVFDGANMWISNLSVNSVTELRVCDGANLGRFATGGHGAEGLAFDGANIWVANTGSNSVAKM